MTAVVLEDHKKYGQQCQSNLHGDKFERVNLFLSDIQTDQALAKTLHNNDAPTKKLYLFTWTSHLHNVVKHVSLELQAAAVVYL